MKTIFLLFITLFTFSCSDPSKTADGNKFINIEGKWKYVKGNLNSLRFNLKEPFSIYELYFKSNNDFFIYNSKSKSCFEYHSYKTYYDSENKSHYLTLSTNNFHTGYSYQIFQLFNLLIIRIYGDNKTTLILSRIQ